MLFFWTFYSSKNPEKMYHGLHKSNKQHNSFKNNYQCVSTWIIKKLFDTEDWSNDAENSALLL